MVIKIGIPNPHEPELPKPELGSPEWFERRAWNSLRPLGDGRFDFSDSALLYSPAGSQGYESAQKINASRYRELITEPEMEQLGAIAPSIVSRLPQQFEFVDLGPGSEKKENFIFNAARKQGKKICYTPVDISQTFLENAATNAKRHGMKVNPARASFEDFAEQNNELGKSRFVSLGLTFGNYAPEEILPLLEKIARRMTHHSYYFINIQQRSQAHAAEIASSYENLLEPLILPKLQLLGLNPRLDVESSWVTPGIEAWCRLRNTTRELEERGIAAGSELQLLRSLRYSEAELETALAGREHTFFKRNGFIGALVRVEASSLAARPGIGEVFGK